MATFALNNCQVYMAEFDLTGQTNSGELTVVTNELDATTFGNSGYRTRVAGLKDVSLNLGGFTDLTDDGQDEQAFAKLGTAGAVTTLVPSGTTDGSVAYMFRKLVTGFTFGGEVGELHKFSLTASGSLDKTVRGTVLHPLTARTSTTTGTGRQLGAVSATQSVYGALHVTAKTGTPTLDVVVQSDDNSGFTTPTTRLTFTQATGLTSEWKSAAGAITDDYWRIVATIGGGSPNITFAVAVGIA